MAVGPAVGEVSREHGVNSDDFEKRLAEFRPRLHRYCARMVGSAIDGEDVLHDSLVKALRAWTQGTQVENLEAWLLRIAHNTSLDFLRRRSRNTIVPLTDSLPGGPEPETDIVAIGFQAFLRLPELQRCAVILKDVLGHSLEEIAAIAGCTPAASKSALQRGRLALRQWARQSEGTRLPLMAESEREKMLVYVRLFQNGDFDAIRTMLADDVRLDLVNRLRLEGRERISPYFTRYAQEPKWRFAFGAIEGRPAMLVFDETGGMERPAHFVLLDWTQDQIAAIRDFLFASYVAETADWVRLG